MKIDKIEKIDSLMNEIYSDINDTKLTDLEFAKSQDTQDKAYEIIEILKAEWINTTYNNLTNMNYHTLVKILNYNWFFDNNLAKNIRDELKTFPLKK